MKFIENNIIDPLGAWAYQYDKPELKQDLLEKVRSGQAFDTVLRMLDTPRRHYAEEILTLFFLDTDKNSHIFKLMVDALTQYPKKLPKDLYLLMQYMQIAHQPSKMAYVRPAQKKPVDQRTVNPLPRVIFESTPITVDANEDQGIELNELKPKAAPIQTQEKAQTEHENTAIQLKKLKLASLQVPTPETQATPALTLNIADADPITTVIAIEPNVLDTLGLTSDEISGQWQRKGDKSGGARPAGKYGGVYTTEQGRTVLIKADDKEEHNLAEFVGSYLNRVIVGEGGVQVIPVPLAGKTYLGSYFLNNFQDLFKYAYAAKNMEVPTERPRLSASLFNRSSSVYKDVMSSAQGKGLETAFISSLLLGDFDMHWGNLGAITDPDTGKLKSIARIDFGWAFLAGELGKLKIGSSFGEEITPNSFFKHMPIAGPTNHWRPVPKAVKSSLAMVTEAMRVAALDLSNAIDQALQQAFKHWPEAVWQTFAQRADLNIQDNSLTFKNLVDAVIEAMQRRIRSRQVSLRDFAVTQLKQHLTYQGTTPMYAGQKISAEHLNTLFPTSYDQEALQQINLT